MAAVELGHIVSWKTREKGKNYNVACEQSPLHCPLYSFYLALTFSSNIFSLPPHTGPPWSTSVSVSLSPSSLLEGASLPARTEMLWTKKLRVGNPRGPLSSPPGRASRSLSLSVSCHRANWREQCRGQVPPASLPASSSPRCGRTLSPTGYGLLSEGFAAFL